MNTCPDRQETVRKGQAQWAKTAKDAMGEWTARWDVDAAYIEGGQKTSIYWDEIEAGGEMGAEVIADTGNGSRCHDLMTSLTARGRDAGVRAGLQVKPKIAHAKHQNS